MTIETKNIGNGTMVTFTKNAEIQAAYEAALATVPKRWADRGVLQWLFLPIDEDYGDMLLRGCIAVKWPNAPGRAA